MKIYKFDIRNLSDRDYGYYRMHMTDSRRERLDRLRFSDDRKRSLCGYMLALKALGEMSGTPQENIRLNYDEKGKPYSDSGLYVSISHSGDFAVCAVSEKAIGIDIEKIRPVNMQTARKFATESELEYIFGRLPEKDDFESTDEKTLERFFEVWTKKEAYGKMLGVGLDYDKVNTKVKDAYTERMGEYIISVSVSENSIEL